MKIYAPTKSQKIAQALAIMEKYKIPKTVYSSLLYDAFGDKL